MTSSLDRIRAEIAAHESNAWARDLGYEPLYSAAPGARIALIGQAPGRKAQESGVPWNDVSGVRLRTWLGVDDTQFYDPDRFAIIPMDFYYPGKGVSGDLPPRKDFASLWHQRILAELPDLRLTVLVGCAHSCQGRSPAGEVALSVCVGGLRQRPRTRVPVPARRPWARTRRARP